MDVGNNEFHDLADTAAGSRTRWMITVIGFAIAAIDGYDTLVLSFIAPLITKEWTMPSLSAVPSRQR